jgi:S-methylmethionine-dependent homocysteine/selenocysteine methylase
VTTHEGPPGQILHGEPIIDLLPQLARAAAVGVNCIDAAHVDANVQFLRMMLKQPVRIMAYANTSFIDDDGKFRESDAAQPGRYAEHAMRWVESGAAIVGGCCGTTPGTIAAIASLLALRNNATA